MGSKVDLKPNQTIVFVGDSITDAGRNEPAYQPLGFGYVHFIANLLVARYPTYNLNIINTGINSNTVRDLKRRWGIDCIEHKPDILSVLIGINDLWRRYAGLEFLDGAAYPDEYESIYRQLLSAAKKECGCQLVLMEPFMFCDEPGNKIFKELRTYSEIVQKLADEFGTVLVPLQTRIDEQIRKVPPQKWSMDSVHPYLWAHAWIAEQWLEVVTS